MYLMEGWKLPLPLRKVLVSNAILQVFGKILDCLVKGGGSFDPSKLDFDNPDREKIKESVLRVLKKIVDLSSFNLQKNSDGLLATRPHNKDILWVGDSGKGIPENVLFFLFKFKKTIRTFQLKYGNLFSLI